VSVKAQLLALQAARGMNDDLEERIKNLEAPLKKQLAELAGKDRSRLRDLRASEDAIAAAAAAAFVAASEARAAAMAADPDHPPVALPLPSGCVVSWLPRVEVTDPAALPRFVLMPDPRALKEALSATIVVDGAKLTQSPSFRFHRAAQTADSSAEIFSAEKSNDYKKANTGL
jgi:hypothetical protein